MSDLLAQAAQPQSKNTVFIYGLVDPRTGFIRYIGKTANTTLRYAGHFSKQELSPNTKKVNWIKSILAHEIKPSLIILEIVEEEHWQEAESRWIDFFREQEGYPALTNGTSGGDGIDKGTKFSEETRRKMSKSRKGRKMPREGVEKGRLARIGKHPSDESRGKMSASQKIFWRNCSEEEKKLKIEKLRKTPEQIEKHRKIISEMNLGTKRPDSTSRYIGVQKIDDSYWRAWIYIDGKNVYLGRFSNEIEAARCRDCASIRLHGNKAKTNFSVSTYSPEEIAKAPAKYGKTIVNTSGYKGVYWSKGVRQWFSAARKNKKQVNIGWFGSTDEGKTSAAHAYDRWVMKNLGATAYTNFSRHNYPDLTS